MRHSILQIVSAFTVTVIAMTAVQGCASHAHSEHQHDHPDHDALIAAGNHHHLKMENDRVRVLETVIKPGETVPLHTHRWPSVYYFVEMSELVVRDAKGVVLSDTRQSTVKRKAGDIAWGEARDLHTVENVGSTTARVISVEIKK